jgi:sugar lactone lactonase YvrE
MLRYPFSFAQACRSPEIDVSSIGGSAAGGAELEVVATFEHQVTGITVTPDNRFFVNFPRWTEDAPVSVAELMPDGSLRPYPDEEWNSWRNAKRDDMTANDHWVCVQSVVADPHGDSLWVIDPGAPAQAQVVPDAPKLVKIDLASNRVVQNIAFDETIAPQGSYLNDIRLSPDRETAYLTDSGAHGAIVVVDLEAGSARRVLDGHPSTQIDTTVQVKSDGEPLLMTDGRGVVFSADGIALSPDGGHLYWQAVKGKTIYRIPTTALLDTQASPDAVGQQVEKVVEHGPADGLHIDAQGRLYITAVEDNAVSVLQDGKVRPWAQAPDFRWPDTLAEGPDGTMYVTDSRIPDMSWFDPNQPIALPTRLLKFRKPA